MKSARQERNHAAMTREILDTARAIMREEGAAALSMQELARRLDIKAPSLYHYFAGKMEIYDALFRLGFEQYERYAQERVAGARTWQEELRHYLEAYMAFAMENPDLYQLCFERPVPGFVPSPESLRVSFGVLQRGYASVARWHENLDTHLSVEQMADLMLAVMHGLTALHMANEPGVPVGQGRFGGLIPAVVSLFEASWTRPSGRKEEIA